MAFGFKPVRMRDGTPYNGASQQCYFDDTANLFVGDIVTLDTEAEAVTGIMKVKGAAAGGAFYGVVVGLAPQVGDLTKTYVASGTTSYVYVATDTNIIFQATEDDGSLVIADVGNNIDAAVGAGDTDTGLSGHSLDSDTHGTGADIQFKLIGRAQVDDNEIGKAAPYTIWEVTINESLAAPNAAGV